MLTTLAAVGAIGALQVEDIKPDLSVHEGVEIRDIVLDPEGPHLVHVTIHGELGARIVGTVHTDEHEYVYVLRGRVMLDLEGTLIPGGPGTVFNIPPGTTHGYIPIDTHCVKCGTVVLLATYRNV